MQLWWPRGFAPGFLAVLILLQSVVSAAAGEHLLVVRNLSDSKQPEVRFTEAELMALPQVTIRTSTEFTDGVIAFEGPLARDVVARVGVGTAETAHMVAANDYSVDVPVQDFFDYDVILALFADGERLTMRDKGPIWLVYPIDAHAELSDPIYNARMIWQLTTVELR